MYAVSCDNDQGYVWSLFEYKLESLSEFISIQDFYGEEPTVIKVVIAPNEKGELIGRLKEENNESKIK